MKMPKNYEEALKQIQKMKAEQLAIFIVGVFLGAVLVLIYITKGGF